MCGYRLVFAINFFNSVQKAAIKKMDMQATNEFLAELKVLTNVHHLNLVISLHSSSSPFLLVIFLAAYVELLLFLWLQRYERYDLWQLNWNWHTNFAFSLFKSNEQLYVAVLSSIMA